MPQVNKLRPKTEAVPNPKVTGEVIPPPTPSGVNKATPPVTPLREEPPPEAKALIQEAALALIQAQQLVISTNEEYELAGEELKRIRGRAKEVNELRLSFTRPLDELKKRWMDFFRPAEEQLKRADTLLSSGRIAYTQEQERQRQVEERRLQEERDREQRKLDLIAEAKAKKEVRRGNVELAEEILDAVPNLPVPIVASFVPKTEGISMRKTWTYRIIDIEKIPRQYMIPNEKMIGDLARASKGTLDIPGVEFYQEIGESVRRSS